MDTTAEKVNQEFDLSHDYFLAPAPVCRAASRRPQRNPDLSRVSDQLADTHFLEDSPPRQTPSLPQPVNPNLWDPRLVLDLAVGVDGLEEILTRYGLTTYEFELLSKTQAFRRELALTIRDVRENGVPFASKARVQAEAYLEVLDRMVHDDTTPASVRLEAIRSTVLWGKLLPKEDKAQDTTNATQINVNISF